MQISTTIFLEFQNGGRTHDFERRKIDTANKEDFSGRIQKSRSTYYKYNKSSNINEVIRPVLNFLFFYDKISQVQNSIKM